MLSGRSQCRAGEALGEQDGNDAVQRYGHLDSLRGGQSGSVVCAGLKSQALVLRCSITG